MSSNSDQLVKLAEIGEQLKRQREEQSIPLTQVTSQTLISERHLKAIEEGNLSSLPEPIYVQGFIRKYGSAVGLNGLAEEFPVNREPLNSIELTKSSTAELRPLHLYGLYIAVITAAISTLAVVLNPARTARIDDSNTNINEIAQIDPADPTEAGREPEAITEPTEPTKPTEPTSQPESVQQLEQSRPGSQSNSANNTANSDTLDTTSDTLDTQSQTEVDSPQVTPAQEQAIASANTTSPGNPSNTNSSGGLNQWIDQVAVASQFDFNGNKPVNVGLQMNGQSWIRVVADGSTVYEGVMPEGAVQAWSADTDIVVRAGNAGAVTIVYNDLPAKTMGSDGEVVEWVFDKEAGIDYGYSAADRGYANQYTYNYIQNY
ncbi:helix-turn-helix domain-containing protein [Thalassoporum mexicanum]|uniref:helix-turn-helix domain-containing protein n=1 Tax=Thalassoporum mexicanum TaxID=3457544 RepID=UPI00030C62CA|nr:helix-turn-helix domain-containing protein [Pseudanabaena sp. PCC 7367]